MDVKGLRDFRIFGTDDEDVGVYVSVENPSSHTVLVASVNTIRENYSQRPTERSAPYRKSFGSSDSTQMKMLTTA